MKRIYKIALLGLVLRGGLSCQMPPIFPIELSPMPQFSFCRPPNLTYNATIKPIFEQHCTRCHGQNNAAKGIRFDYYWATKTLIADDTTRFLCVINHRDDCLAMPIGAPKLDDCTIQKLETWVRAGLVEN